MSGGQAIATPVAALHGQPVAGSPAAMVAGRATVEVVNTVAGFAALREEWDGLLQDSRSDCLFLTWEWLYTWSHRLGARRRLEVVTVREAGRLLGAAPLALRLPSARRCMPVRSLEFLGTGTVGSDYLDIIARRGREEEVIEALAAYLDGARRPILMAQLDASGSVAARLALVLGARGWDTSLANTDVCPYVRFGAAGWDGYYRSLGRRHRRSLRQKEHGAERLHRVEFTVAESEPERARAFAAFVDLHYRRWRGARRSQALSGSAIVSFHDGFSRIALARGWLRLSVLSFDARPVAAIYGFAYGRRFYYYQAGFDPGFSRFSVGSMCLEKSMQSALAEGAEEYDFLHGAEPYKLQWTRATRELACCTAYPPSFGGRSARLGAALRRRVKRLLQRAPPAADQDRSDSPPGSIADDDPPAS